MDGGGVGVGGAGEGGVGVAAGVDADTALSAAADDIADDTGGSGLDWWELEEDAPPDIDPADVDAIVSQLLL